MKIFIITLSSNYHGLTLFLKQCSDFGCIVIVTIELTLVSPFHCFCSTILFSSFMTVRLSLVHISTSRQCHIETHTHKHTYSHTRQCTYSYMCVHTGSPLLYFGDGQCSANPICEVELADYLIDCALDPQGADMLNQTRDIGRVG